MRCRSRRSAKLLGLGAASVLALAAALAVPAAARERAPEGEKVFHIPAQSLSRALADFSRQSDLIVVAPTRLTVGKSAPEVTGEFAPYEALGRLLQGSGLGYARDEDGSITVVEPPATKKTGSIAGPTRLAQVAETERRSDAVSDVEPIQQDDAGDEEQEVLQSLPQNFGGGPNDDTATVTGSGNGANFNFFLGFSVNLRGLGADSTLTLFNCRRTAATGAGTFVDVSSIPLSAVERIEVLTDGASAIYGADAVGGVVNIVLRRDYEGAETSLRFGSVTDGGQQEYQVGQSYGTNWSTGHFLVSYEYSKRERLLSEDRDFAASEDLTAFGGSDFRDNFSNPGNIITGDQFAIPADQDGVPRQRLWHGFDVVI